MKDPQNHGFQYQNIVLEDWGVPRFVGKPVSTHVYFGSFSGCLKIVWKGTYIDIKKTSSSGRPTQLETLKSSKTSENVFRPHCSLLFWTIEARPLQRKLSGPVRLGGALWERPSLSPGVVLGGDGSGFLTHGCHWWLVGGFKQMLRFNMFQPYLAGMIGWNDVCVYFWDGLKQPEDFVYDPTDFFWMWVSEKNLGRLRQKLHEVTLESIQMRRCVGHLDM